MLKESLYDMPLSDKTMATLKEQLLTILRAIDFDRRYYGYYEHVRDRDSDRTWSKQEIARVLAESRLAFKYLSSDRLFMHSYAVESVEINLSIRVRDSEAELLLEIAKADELVGGPFQLLAKEVAQRREPGFTYDPPYPWLPFTSEDELKSIIQFGIDAFEQVKEALEH